MNNAGMPYLPKTSLCSVLRVQFPNWPLGQAVKTAASHAANRSSILLGVTIYAPLAQLVEHLTLNQGVQGSSP